VGLLDSAAKATRSAAAIGSLSTGFAVGAAIAVANRSRRDGANVAVGLSSQLALASAGIHLNIQGEENAFSHRPAVFLFNHQSELDVFIVAGVLRKDFAAVAKKSLQTNPVFGPIATLAGVAFIDRADPAQARAALQPVVDSLSEGISVALAPEGTRSSGLGPFKKGAFHMAIQGEVPVVPIVIRNAAELMPPHSYLINPGTVDVVVLPPIDTSEWVAENVDQYRDEVWQLYRTTLDDWPEPDDVG
jgi:putative phosphoserine phosphatase / 1-acylglycerol-3-phosphate O-acyltransferase